jgi:glycosyltransferase involved in cell wall biosynthesis
MKLPLTLVVITRDEEANIERCLKSVPFASHVVVLDDDSKDKTKEIAFAFGAKVFVQKFLGFGPQKRKAVEYAETDWVLSLDADEALSDELAAEIIRRFENGPPKEAAFEIARLSFHMGRWIRHGGWFPDWQIRLFDRRRANWDHEELHEKVIVEGDLGRVREPIRHWVFKDLHDQIRTNNRYSTIGAEMLLAKGKRFSYLKLLLKPVSKFLETYVWKLGFLDGLPGFVIAVGAAYSIFLRFAKLWELEKKRKTSSSEM